MSAALRSVLLLATSSLGLLVAGPAAAQLFTPSFLSPVRGGDAGVYLSGGFGPSDDLAVEGIWRVQREIYDLGLRAGLQDRPDDLALLLGADYRNPLEVDAAPLQLAATGGAQAVIGNSYGGGYGVDVGISVGSTFSPEGWRVTPYLHPRVGLVRSLRGEGPGLRVLADLGADLSIGQNLVARLALGLGGPTADFSLGLAWH